MDKLQNQTLPGDYRQFMKLKIHDEMTGITTYIDMSDYVMPFAESSIGQNAVQDNVAKLIFEFDSSGLSRQGIDLEGLQFVKIDEDASVINDEKCKQNMRS